MTSISTLEDKGMRIDFINGKVLSWTKGSRMKDAINLGSIVGGLYRVIGRPLLEKFHDTNHQSEIWHRNKTKYKGPYPSNNIKTDDNSKQDKVVVRK